MARKPIVFALVPEHGRRLAHTGHIFAHARVKRVIIGREAVYVAVVSEKIGCAVNVDKRPYIPLLYRFALVEQRALECIWTCYALGRCVGRARVFISEIVAVHYHHIFTRGRAAQHLWTLTHAARPETPVGLLAEGYTLVSPILKVGRQIAAEAGEHICRVGLELAEHIISSVVLDYICAVSRHYAVAVVMPRHAVYNRCAI